MTEKYLSRISQMRVCFIVGLIAALSTGAFAGEPIIKQIVHAGWENAFFLSAPIIAWLVGSAIYRAKIDLSTPPGEAARSSFWWLLGVFAFICAVVLLVILAWDAPWWLWLILIGVPVLCFFIGFMKGRGRR